MIVGLVLMQIRIGEGCDRPQSTMQGVVDTRGNVPEEGEDKILNKEKIAALPLIDIIQSAVFIFT